MVTCSTPEAAAGIFLEPGRPLSQVAEVRQPCHPCAGAMLQKAHPSTPQTLTWASQQLYTLEDGVFHKPHFSLVTVKLLKHLPHSLASWCQTLKLLQVFSKLEPWFCCQASFFLLFRSSLHNCWLLHPLQKFLLFIFQK